MTVKGYECERKKLHWYEAKSDSKVNKMTGNLILNE